MRLAVYAGTFDPLTLGHLSVIERGAALFDRLVVVIAVNPDKQPLFSVDERARMIGEAVQPWPNVSVTTTPGYVVHLARDLGAGYLVRGVRGVTDIEAEVALAHANHALAPEIETVFVPAHLGLSAVSSSGLKALARQGGDLSPYCTPEVAAALRRRLGATAPAEEVSP